jgi:hypothetical protein
MKRASAQQGDREVQPDQKRGSAGRGAKQRRKERRALARAEAAHALVEELEATVSARHNAWGEGGHPMVTLTATDKLDALHEDKRELRRDVYRAAPQLEGSEVRRHTSRRLAG